MAASGQAVGRRGAGATDGVWARQEADAEAGETRRCLADAERRCEVRRGVGGGRGARLCAAGCRGGTLCVGDWLAAGLCLWGTSAVVSFLGLVLPHMCW